MVRVVEVVVLAVVVAEDYKFLVGTLGLCRPWSTYYLPTYPEVGMGRFRYLIIARFNELVNTV